MYGGKNGETTITREQKTSTGDLKWYALGITIMFSIWAVIVLGFSFSNSGIKGLNYKSKSADSHAGTWINNPPKSHNNYTSEERKSARNQIYAREKIHMNSLYTDDWRILLVNENNPIPENYSVELAYIDGKRKFDSRAIDDLKNLIRDCRDETGGVIWAQSAYRDRDTQERLLKEEIEKHIKKGVSRSQAEILASSVIAAPGTSEHETGLAVDFNNIDMEFEDSKAFGWLWENAHKYGFILRYPEGKEDITGILYEPWHFRYVGRDHAEMMKLKDFCLEEYIEYLQR